MFIKKKNRRFKPSQYSSIVLKDCAQIILNDDEQVTFSNKFGNNNYDICKKNWGYYATPSVNNRLSKNKFETHIVINTLTKFFYIFLVEKNKKKVFLKYLKKEKLTIVPWPKKLVKYFIN